MPSVIVTRAAHKNVVRLREFLRERSPQAAFQFGNTLADTLDVLEHNPRIGRPNEDIVGLHRLVMPFGATSYVLHYRYLSSRDVLYVLRIRNEREAERGFLV